MLNIKQLKAIVENTTSNGVTFASVVQVTEPKMNKGGRGQNPVNPYYGRVTKRTKSVIMLGNNYQRAVENRTKKVTGEPVEYEVSPMKGRHWLEGFEDLIEEADNGSGQQQLRTYDNMSNSTPQVE